VLWRIHAASALLVVPQFTVSTFALVFLVDARGWRAPVAGSLLAVTAAGGAASRLGAGHWSDRLGSRMRPMRILALATTAVLVALALAAAFTPVLAVPILLAAAVLVVSTNGLAYTAVAERAGPAWAGRALGIHNTGQNALAALTPPIVAVLIGAAGYPAAFALAGALPLAAAALVPLAAERRAAAQAAGPAGPAPPRAAPPDLAGAAGPAPAPRSHPRERPPPAPSGRRARRRRTPAATNAAGPGARPSGRRADRPRPGDRSRPDEP
jgi:MFS family permease